MFLSKNRLFWIYFFYFYVFYCSEQEHMNSELEEYCGFCPCFLHGKNIRRYGSCHAPMLLWDLGRWISQPTVTFRGCGPGHDYGVLGVLFFANVSRHLSWPLDVRSNGRAHIVAWEHGRYRITWYALFLHAKPCPHARLPMIRAKI